MSTVPMTMRVATQSVYGGPDVLRVVERPVPLPQRGEMLIRVRAATVSSGDARIRAFDVPAPFWLPGRLAIGLTRPRQPVLGYDVAGEVAAIGEGVTRFVVGDRVFGMHPYGGHAEYRIVPEQAGLARIPSGIGDAEAASIPFGGTTALDFWRRGGLISQQRVLVVGGSGAVGTMAVQLARIAGAEVEAVTSAANAELVTGLGARRVLDYTRPDHALEPGRYDLVFDTVGALRPQQALAALRPGGKVLVALPSVQMMFAQLRHRARIMGGEAKETSAGMGELAALMASGALVAVIDSTYPLADIALAHRRVDTHRKRGTVVVTMTGRGGAHGTPD